jgi:hypothetical protein
MDNKVIEVNTVEEFDSLNEKEKMVVYITHFRLDLYNKGFHCGAKAIQKKLREEDLTPVPSISTINRALKSQYLTNGRTGYYEEDDPLVSQQSLCQRY